MDSPDCLLLSLYNRRLEPKVLGCNSVALLPIVYSSLGLSLLLADLLLSLGLLIVLPWSR